VRFYRPPENADDEHLSVRITTRPSLRRLDLDGLLDQTRTGLRLSRPGDDDIVEVDGDIDRQTVGDLEDRIWDHMDARHRHLRHLAPEQFGTFTDAVLREHHSDPLGLTQLLLVHRILSAQKWMLLRVPLHLHQTLVHEHGPDAGLHEADARRHEHP
jgi:hypothetical protein